MSSDGGSAPTSACITVAHTDSAGPANIASREPVEADGQRAPPALDQAIGVQAHRACPGAGAIVLVCRRPLVATPMGRSAGRSRIAAGRSAPAEITGGGCPAERQAHLLPGRVDHRTQDGGHDVGLELVHLAVEAVQQLGGVGGVQGVRAQRVPQPPHLDRGGQSAADDVADHDADGARRRARTRRTSRRPPGPAARDVAGGELEPRDRPAARRAAGCAAAPWPRPARPRRCGPARPGRSGRPPVGAGRVVAGERARGESADVQDAEHGAADEQWHPEQRPDALLAQDRVEHVGVVDLFEDHGPLLRGDAAGEALAEGDPHPLADLLLDAPGGGRDQVLARRVQQEHRGGVDVEQLTDPVEEFVEQLVDVELCQPGVGHRLQAPEPVAELAHGWGFST